MLLFQKSRHRVGRVYTALQRITTSSPIYKLYCYLTEERGYSPHNSCAGVGGGGGILRTTAGLGGGGGMTVSRFNLQRKATERLYSLKGQ